MIGEKIQHYIITRLIGEGGMASVYEATHEKLQSKVAIKVLNPILTSSATIRARFENEARFMAGLNHVNITRVIDYEERPDLLAIIMEFLEGEDLNVQIKREGAMSLTEVLPIITQVLDAFEYAHNKSIVHRDVKPSNIFIEPSKTVKILDFGIAKLLGDSGDMTATGTQIGTPVYMSPEQVNTDKSLDHRSDIYSPGVTLFYMLNGKPPYDTTTTSSFQIFTKIVFEPLPDLVKYPEIDKILKIATHKDPANRFQSCAAFKKALLEAVKPDKDSPETKTPGYFDDDKTLIDIPEPALLTTQSKIKKEKVTSVPIVKENSLAQHKENKVNENSATNGFWQKYQSRLWIILVSLMAIIFILMKLFPGWYSKIFDNESRKLARQKEATSLLLKVKAEYKKQPEARNYDSTVFFMQKAADLVKENPEVLLYLSDGLYHQMTPMGDDIPKLSYNGIKKASEAIERIFKINPEYKNDSLPTDPYSRTTIYWGELALHYLAEGKNDSALIAYKEGRKRGGFNDVLLELARNTMNSCENNAILIFYSDIVYHPILYMQLVEEFRTDIKTIITGFMHTDWYFGYITNTLSIPVSYTAAEFSSLKNIPWQQQVVTVRSLLTEKDFSWWVYPNMTNEMNKTGQLMLDIFKSNQLYRPFCFSIAIDQNNSLNLLNYLEPFGWIYKTTTEPYAGASNTHLSMIKNLSYEALKKSHSPSTFIRAFLDFVRSNYLKLINDFYDNGDFSNARTLMKFLSLNVPTENYPVFYKDIDPYLQSTMNKVLFTEDQLKEKENKNIKEYLIKNNLSGVPAASGLYYFEKVSGMGIKPQAGKKVKVHYMMSLLDETKIDSSYDKNLPLEFEYGSKSVIPGFEEGIGMMSKGTKALFIIPYSLGYGTNSQGTIPAYSTLIAEVELLDIY
ncbi:MAG: protein kinase [Lentimicrobium sp.]|jgi:serine/threonine protein kinase/FKBP-type peptidyl-prolyl cis-trans isomerase|nr:protein kinase [Lentimicrobium sp.]